MRKNERNSISTKGGKYSAQIAIHQAELKREETFTDQKYLSIISLQTDYLNIDSSSGSGKTSEMENLVQKMHFLWRC